MLDYKSDGQKVNPIQGAFAFSCIMVADRGKLSWIGFSGAVQRYRFSFKGSWDILLYRYYALIFHITNNLIINNVSADSASF